MRGGAFELRQVSKQYDGVIALADVSFTVAAGEHTVVLGSSGSGKSTALRLLAGLEAPCSGQVVRDGVVVSKANRIVIAPHQRGVAMVFQDLALWPNLSVLNNVVMGQAATRRPRQERQGRASEVLSLCGIGELADRLPDTLSGGQQQRVALARALAPHPGFLFLDEPFTGLDLVLRTKLITDIRRLADEEESTIVLVTHDVLEALALSSRVVVLDQGRVAQSGQWDEVLQNPQSEILRVFRDHLPVSPRVVNGDDRMTH